MGLVLTLKFLAMDGFGVGGVEMSVLLAENFQGGLDVLAHDVLGVADGPGGRGAPLSLRLKFLLADPVHIVIVRLSPITKFYLKAVTLVFASSACSKKREVEEWLGPYRHRRKRS